MGRRAVGFQETGLMDAQGGKELLQVGWVTIWLMMVSVFYRKIANVLKDGADVLQASFPSIPARKTKGLANVEG